MDHPQTPRILASHLSNFQHRIVRILGKVVQLKGDTAVIDAGGQVDVILNRVCFLILLFALCVRSYRFSLAGFAVRVAWASMESSRATNRT